MNSPSVSILIAARNAEQYIDDCLSSICHHGMTSPIELICVDDCSEDNTIDKINNHEKELARCGVNLRIYRQNYKLGISATRNKCLELANGEYIYFIDADDTIATGTINTLYTRAIECQADVVGCEWWLVCKSKHRYMSQPAVNSPADILQNFALGKSRWNLWLYLIRRELIINNKVTFVAGADIAEDLMFMSKTLKLTSVFTLIHQPLYYYRQINYDSASSKFTPKAISDISTNVNHLEDIYTEHQLRQLKISIKYPLLVSGSSKDIDTWLNWWKEPIYKIFINRHISLRYKILQILAYCRQYWLLKLYHLLTLRLLYGGFK